MLNLFYGLAWAVNFAYYVVDVAEVSPEEFFQQVKYEFDNQEFLVGEVQYTSMNEMVVAGAKNEL